MRRKRLLTLGGAICLALILAALPFMSACAPREGAPGEAIQLKIAGFVPWGNPNLLGLEDLMERVAEKSNGKLTIEWVGGPEAIPPMKILDAVQTGVIDIGRYSAPFYEAVFPEGIAWANAWMRPWEARETGLYDIMNELHQEKLGLYLLGSTSGACWYGLSSNVRLESLDDFAGVRIRAGAKAFMEAFQALGASTLYTPTAEQYSAIERGLFDAHTNALGTVMGFSLYEVTKYFMEMPMANYPGTYIMNLDSWNRLPTNLQNVLIEASLENELWLQPEWQRLEKEWKQICLDGGMEIISLPPDEAEQLETMIFNVLWNELRAKAPENFNRLYQVVVGNGYGHPPISGPYPPK